MSHKAPKQWSLTTDESMTSFTNWKENLMYTLSLDRNFNRFLSPEVTWTEVCDEHPHRGLTDDPTSIPADERHSKEIKCTHLNLLLGQIANYANIISRNQIVQESTSINSIWAMIREHYGFHVTGSRFLDLSSIRLKTGEKPADLYQRIVSFFNDNLFTTSSNLKHNGKDPVRDERISISLQNTIVVLWLERLHVGLPGLVKQRYGAELRNKTLASIKPEISMALDSLLDELRSSDDTRILRSQIPRSNFGRGSRTTSGSYSKPKEQSYYNPKVCCLCKTANRPSYESHYLSQCKYLPEPDRRMMTSRIRQIDTEEAAAEEDDLVDTIDNSLFIDNPSPAVHRRVVTKKSPHMNCFYNHYPAEVCIDTGAESSLISERFASYVGIPIQQQSVRQNAVQADATSRLDIIGEAKNVKIRRGSHVFEFDALVTRNDVGDIIAGEPFLESNDIAVRPSKKQIIIKGREIIPYSNTSSGL